MIPRAELLMALSTLRDLEERGTALAVLAIEKAIPGAGLSEENQKFLTEEVLQVIRDESSRHMKMVEGLISGLKEDTRDAL